jgi:cytochrome P450
MVAREVGPLAAGQWLRLRVSGCRRIMLEGRLSNPPHVPRGRSIIDARAMVRNPVAVLEAYRARLGPTFTFHFGGVKRSLATTDPMVVEHVLRGNRDNYEKSHIQIDRLVEFQGRGLITIHGDAWLRQRRLVAQGFRPSHLTKLLPLQQDMLRELMSGFDREARQGPVDVYDQMVRFTLRLVGRALFGRSVTDAELEQIGDTISAIHAFILRQIIQPYRIPWFRISGQTGRHQRLRRGGEAIVLKHIRERMKQGVGEADILRILLDTPYSDTGQPMEEAQAMIESLQLMVAGNATSSNALTWIFYLLARHPRHIVEIRDEIEAVIGNAPIDYRNLHLLEGTMRVINEALRLYPPLWAIDRIALQDDEVAGMRVPAGAMVLPYIYGTHRNPAHWDDAETFNPRRFEPEQSEARHPFAFIPFGGGPRTCVGNNMALMQILLIIVAFVRRYDFALATHAPVAIRPMMLVSPAGPVAMKFRAVS